MKKIVIACIIILSILFVGCSDKTSLHIFTWSDYVDPALVQQFESENNCQVVIDTFDSNESMYAKLKSGATGYDIIVPSSYFVELLAGDNLIQELDLSKITNVVANFDQRFSTLVVDNASFKHSVPYAVSYTGLMYSKSELKDLDVFTWGILTNSAFRGKTTLLDDMREVIGAALIFNGFSASSSNEVEIAKATQTAIEWRQNIRKFDAESYKVEVADGSTYIGQGYSMDAYQIILGDEENGQGARDDIGFALPREGFAASCDEFTIAAKSKNLELAYKFISFMYRPEIAKANMEYIVGVMPVKAAIEMLDDDYRNLVVLPEETLKKAHIIKKVDQRARELYNKAWDQIKSMR